MDIGNKKFIPLNELEVYKLSRELSKIGWEVYQQLNWQNKKVIGDQFISAIDSIGANIAEGYGRYHYLDRIKFFYNARGSLIEAIHWLNLLHERKLITIKDYKNLHEISEVASFKLQNFISSIYKLKK